MCVSVCFLLNWAWFLKKKGKFSLGIEADNSVCPLIDSLSLAFFHCNISRHGEQKITESAYNIVWIESNYNMTTSV